MKRRIIIPCRRVEQAHAVKHYERQAHGDCICRPQVLSPRIEERPTASPHPSTSQPLSKCLAVGKLFHSFSYYSTDHETFDISPLDLLNTTVPSPIAHPCNCISASASGVDMNGLIGVLVASGKVERLFFETVYCLHLCMLCWVRVLITPQFAPTEVNCLVEYPLMVAEEEYR